jgi:phospholipid/cholesterol/gamma-HCH transport system ATP-binding protein
MPDSEVVPPPNETGDSDRPVVVCCRGVQKSYGDRVVLKGIDIEVHKGETLVVMGGSGHGKSTALRLMIGAERPDGGTIHIFGREITGLTEEQLHPIKKRFGVLFQGGALFNSMTCGENIALPIREHAKLDEKIIDIIVKLKLELVGLRDAENLMPSQISGGMKKRVGLARAIALDPEIIFYDEPGAGLDPIVLASIDELIVGLGKKLGVASIVVTHEMQSAFRIADRMVLLHRGEIVAKGTPDEIRGSKDPLVQQFIQGKAEGPVPLRMSRSDFAQDLLEDNA